MQLDPIRGPAKRQALPVHGRRVTGGVFTMSESGNADAQKDHAMSDMLLDPVAVTRGQPRGARRPRNSG